MKRLKEKEYERTEAWKWASERNKGRMDEDAPNSFLLPVNVFNIMQNLCKYLSDFRKEF